MRTILGRFPVRMALVALVIYLLTLSRGVTVNSLGLTAKVAGWDWQPMVGHPVLWLVTLPWRLLPGGWVAVGLNIFSALCGAATLGILARSLELLPWNERMESLAGWKTPAARVAGCGGMWSAIELLAGSRERLRRDAGYIDPGRRTLVLVGISLGARLALVIRRCADLGVGHG